MVSLTADSETVTCNPEEITIAGFGDKDVVPKMVELISRWNEWGSAPLRERKKHPTVQLQRLRK